MAEEHRGTGRGWGPFGEEAGEPPQGRRPLWRHAPSTPPDGGRAGSRAAGFRAVRGDPENAENADQSPDGSPDDRVHLTGHLLTGAVGLCLLALAVPPLLLNDEGPVRRPEATATPPADRGSASPHPSSDSGTRPPPGPGPAPRPEAPSSPSASAFPSALRGPTTALPAAPVGATEPQTSPRSSPTAGARRANAVVVHGTSVLEPGQSWTGDRVVLTLQGDGNLVLHDREGRPTWASGTTGLGAMTVFQADGNLVVYTRDMRPAWSSRTDGHDGAELVLGTDGNLVVRHGDATLWAAGTTG